MVKRFNNLDAALKYLRPTTATSATEVPDAPAGTPLKKYQDYKAGKVAITYTWDAASKPGNLLVASVKPFAVAPGSTQEMKVDFSDRAKGKLETFGLTEASLGIDITPPDTVVSAAGFRPAKAICRQVTGTTSSEETSEITGLKYKKTDNSSYTFPVGQAGTDTTWAAQKGAITAALAAKTGVNISVSFKSEVY